jgi:Ca2+-binding RTX toxin-like protein
MATTFVTTTTPTPDAVLKALSIAERRAFKLLTGTSGDDNLSVFGAREPLYNSSTTYDRYFIRGLGGNDVLRGGHGADQIFGEEGNDTLLGGHGNDLMDGGIGNDTVDYSLYRGAIDPGTGLRSGMEVDLAAGFASVRINPISDTDTLVSIENVNGSDAADFIRGDNNANIIHGEFGADLIVGAGGNDIISGGFGNDVLGGDAGDDTISGGEGNDFINGGADFDTIDYSYLTSGVTVQLQNNWGFLTEAPTLDFDTLIDFEAVIGTGSADVIEGNGLGNVLDGRQGDDTISGFAGTDHLVGGEGDDTLMGGADADLIFGDVGFDTASYINSTAAVSVNLKTNINSGGEALGDKLYNVERLVGSNFNDTLTGTDGNNTLDGMGGNDLLVGLNGENWLSGGAGDDTLLGGNGFNFFRGGAGADILNGGTGFTIAGYEESAAGVTINLTRGTGVGGDAQGDVLINVNSVNASDFADVLTGNINANTISAGKGNDRVDGGAGADLIDGDDGNDVLAGGTGADELFGGDGNDSLNGGDNNDYLEGNSGADRLAGGLGADIFNFISLVDSTIAVTGRDTIVDFQNGTDTIDLSAIDAIIGLEMLNQAFTFNGTANFAAGVSGQLRYSTVGANTLIEAEVNGNQVADFAILVNGIHTFIADDFIL